MKILLIVPCFNEEDRIDLALFESGKLSLRQQGHEVTYLFANDGSTDKTEQMLKLHSVKSGDIAFSAPQNVGKANVIFSAFQSISSDKISAFDWVGYWDADLATPIAEIGNMMSFVEIYQSQPISSVWGSRVSRLGSKIERKPYRHYLGRIFVTLVSVVLDVKAYDSQCGAKLFRPSAAKVAFAESFISRWIFDVEILLRMKNELVIEYPLMQWRDVPGSKVKIFREMFRVLKDLRKIKKTYLV